MENYFDTIISTGECDELNSLCDGLALATDVTDDNKFIYSVALDNHIGNGMMSYDPETDQIMMSCYITDNDKNVIENLDYSCNNDPDDLNDILNEFLITLDTYEELFINAEDVTTDDVLLEDDIDDIINMDETLHDVIYSLQNLGDKLKKLINSKDDEDTETKSLIIGYAGSVYDLANDIEELRVSLLPTNDEDK